MNGYQEEAARTLFTANRN